jgi:hypothetical protein
VAEATENDVRGRKMVDRLFVGVLGHRRSGKSTTWNTLFGRTVHTGSNSRRLELRPNECVEVFLISGSNEERNQYAGDVLQNQDARIILCSIQYVRQAADTIDYIESHDFWTHIQWLNPGFNDDDAPYFDYLGIGNRLLSMGSTLAMRSGKDDPDSRVQELREFISGWALYRNLIVSC